MCKVVVLPIKPFVFLTFLYCLFIMDLSLQSNKTNNWSADNLNKNMSPQLDVHLSLSMLQSGDTGQPYPFCQLSIDHNMDVHYKVKHRFYMNWTPS